ncbi:MAG TPA: hypothetical protein VMR45_04535 [Patescibacteria group bacterium]|nr:hypothetical protein [Patescibacteria group bacterium]
MASSVIYRNVRARDQLEIFLLAAVSSLLLVRVYLHLTGYPQIGSGDLHIAHMLWGGALMLAALVVSLSFLGTRARSIVAIVGGAGFGIFIDELGKFVTSDNNYFYKPTVGLIYAIFIIIYLVANFLSQQRHISSREYQLNALSQLEEAIAQDLDPKEKASINKLLARANQSDPITKQLQKLLDSANTIPRPRPNLFNRFLSNLDKIYKKFWRQRRSNLWVQIFFLCEVALFVIGVLATIYSGVDSALDIFNGNLSYSKAIVLGQLISSLVAAGFAAWGAILLTRSRLRAYEQFRRATLINIFLTQFFIFSRIEFGALPGFFFNLALLGLISYAIRQEQHNLVQ